MTRENVLFTIIGVLFGYVVAFTFVIYVNQNEAATAGGAQVSAAAVQPSGDLPADHPPVSTNSVKDDQRLQSAAEQAAQRARQEPSDFDAQISAANAYAQAEKYEEVLDFLTRAIRLRPGDYETLIKLGQANIETKRYEVAEKWLREAVAKRPEDLDNYSSLALTYLRRTPPDYDRAVAELRHALEASPRYEPALHNLTLVYKAAGRMAEAEATLAQLEKINPNNTDLPELREALRQ